MPKPSVALWAPKPMISTVASPTAPVAAETPIASPSARLCSPIATATVSPVRSALRSALSASAAASIEALCSATGWPGAIAGSSAEPPASGGSDDALVLCQLARNRRSSAGMPAQPATKPASSIANRPATLAKEPWWCR